MDWDIVGWKISFCSEVCICSEFLGLYYEWMVSLPKMEDELFCRTSQTNWSPSEPLGWPNWILCTGNFPFIMVSGGQMWDMEVSWEGFCKVVLGMLMFGCSGFPCPSRTVPLTRTGIVCVCVQTTHEMWKWLKENIIARQRTWSRRSIGTRDRWVGLCRANCQCDGSGKMCIGVCHWKNQRPDQRLSSRKAT